MWVLGEALEEALCACYQESLQVQFSSFPTQLGSYK